MTDHEIVKSILNRDPVITKEYLYKTCYPLFYSIYNKYYTDCNSVVELINDIYVYILHPNKDTGKCKLESFGYRCTLTMWLKIVTENYCHQLFKKKLDCFFNSIRAFAVWLFILLMVSGGLIFVTKIVITK